MVLTGNEAIALGSLAAGCRFISSYPMTPASGVMQYMARQTERLPLAFEQAEDEIAAINMLNTFKWFRERVYDVNEEGHDPADLVQAFRLAQEWGDRIPTGIFFDDQEPRPGFKEALLGSKKQHITRGKLNPMDVTEMMEEHL